MSAQVVYRISTVLRAPVAKLMTTHLVNLRICRIHLRGIGQQLFALLLRIRLEAERKVTGKHPSTESAPAPVRD